MRDSNSIHKLCRICLNQGSRDIFHESNFMTRNLVSQTDELERLQEKLRYVTLLKVSVENLIRTLLSIERAKKVHVLEFFIENFPVSIRLLSSLYVFVDLSASLLIPFNTAR